MTAYWACPTHSSGLTCLIAELKVKIAQLEIKLATAWALTTMAPNLAPPLLAPSTGLDMVNRACAAITTVAETKKIQLPPITLGFKANPLDIGESIVHLSLLPIFSFEWQASPLSSRLLLPSLYLLS